MTLFFMMLFAVTALPQYSAIPPRTGQRGFSLLELSIDTYSPNELPTQLADIPAIKPGSRWLKA